MVNKRKNVWFLGLPYMTGKDPETGEKVRFPVFSYVNQEKANELKKLIIAKGRKYIEDNVLGKENRQQVACVTNV